MAIRRMGRGRGEGLDEIAADRLFATMACHGEAYQRLANERLAERLSARMPLMIFGAGQNGRLVQTLLRAAGLEPAAFIDDTPAKIGQVIETTPIIGLEAATTTPGAIAVCSIFSPGHEYLAVAARLRARGIETVSLFAFLAAFGGETLPFYFLDTPGRVLDARDDLAWLAGRLADGASADLLCAQVEFRLTLRHEVLPPWTSRREPPPAAWASFALIDAGAFDGDTLLPMMAGQGERISAALALEPDPVTFAALQRNIAAAGPVVAAKAVALQAAADAVSGRRAFASVGNPGSGFSEAGEPVRTFAIDDLVEARLPGEDRLYIKFDVEGAEADALRGAARTIAARRPFLAVSAYHRPQDLWSLPRQISDLDAGYRYALRSHGADGADLMLYAIPPS